MSTVQSQFVFQAMTPTGRRTLGVRAAGSEGLLAEDLRREQLLLLRAWRVPIGGAPPARLPLRDEAALNDQLGTLLSRGVPLVEALEVAASVVTPATRGRVDRMREAVAAGAAFSDACTRVGGFDAVTSAVYRSAERTGDLAGACKRLALSAKRRQSLRGKAATVLIYPSIVCLLSTLIFFGLLVFVVPMIADQIRQMNAKLNWFSAVVFGTGEWMRGHLGLVVMFIALIVVLAIVVRRWLLARLVALMHRVPAVARLLLTVEMARFFSVMAAMLRTGVTLSDGLATAAGAITDPRLRRQLESLQRGLVEGGIWRVLVEKVDALPVATRKLLIAAERAGDLDSAFENLATDTAEEVDTRAARLVAILEPGAIVLMFALIGPLILAIAIPMLTARIQVGG